MSPVCTQWPPYIWGGRGSAGRWLTGTVAVNLCVPDPTATTAAPGSTRAVPTGTGGLPDSVPPAGTGTRPATRTSSWTARPTAAPASARGPTTRSPPAGGSTSRSPPTGPPAACTATAGRSRPASPGRSPPALPVRSLVVGYKTGDDGVAPSATAAGYWDGWMGAWPCSTWRCHRTRSPAWPPSAARPTRTGRRPGDDRPGGDPIDQPAGRWRSGPAIRGAARRAGTGRPRRRRTRAGRRRRSAYRRPAGRGPGRSAGTRGRSARPE